LEEVQTTLRTKELTNSKGLKFDDNGENLNISRGKGMSRGKTYETQRMMTSQSRNALILIRPVTSRGII